MSIFGKIKTAIFGADGGPFGDHYLGGRKDKPAANGTPGTQPTPAPRPTPAPNANAPVQGAPASPAAQPNPTPVDPVAAIERIAQAKGNPALNWRTSIVDLLKLLDIDSSRENRNELAGELGYTGPKDGSAEMNIWLHRAVMAELAKSGGQVPAYLKD
ncbi:DUF3597 domain-containing protein [Sphingomonas sp.]